MLLYDMVVIGGGAAGLVAAKLARGLGQKVLIIEKNKLGGVCTWTGCIPSKALLKVAQVAYRAQDLKRFGIKTKHPLQLDFSGVMAHVHERINHVYTTHTPEVLLSQGIETRFGSPVFVDKFTLEVNQTYIRFKKCIIATGTSAAIPSIEGLDSDMYFTNENFFEIKNLPESLIIIGGGPTGIELSSALIRLGVKVTLIEMNDLLLSREDNELSALLTKKLMSQGLTIYTGVKAQRISRNGSGILLTCKTKDDKEIVLTAQKLLLAVGRNPNIDNLNLEAAGVAVTSKSIVTDTTLRTTAKHIYACGDVVGPYLFSHMAEYQASIAVRNAVIPFFKKHVDYSQVVWVTFTDPEFASAGLSYQEARRKFGDSVHVRSYEYKNIDRARVDNEEFGMAKIVLNKKNKIVGSSILGVNAGEIIHEIQLGKYYNIPFAKFYAVIHAYPTYSEVLWLAAKKEYIASLENNKWLKLVRLLFGY